MEYSKIFQIPTYKCFWIFQKMHSDIFENLKTVLDRAEALLNKYFVIFHHQQVLLYEVNKMFPISTMLYNFEVFSKLLTKYTINVLTNISDYKIILERMEFNNFCKTTFRDKNVVIYVYRFTAYFRNLPKQFGTCMFEHFRKVLKCPQKS